MGEMREIPLFFPRLWLYPQLTLDFMPSQTLQYAIPDLLCADVLDTYPHCLRDGCRFTGAGDSLLLLPSNKFTPMGALLNLASVLDLSHQQRLSF